jgi:hypothetical protein
VITTTTILFFLMVMFIFWLGGLGEKGHAAAAEAPGGHPTPKPAPIAGGSREG